MMDEIKASERATLLEDIGKLIVMIKEKGAKPTVFMCSNPRQLLTALRREAEYLPNELQNAVNHSEYRLYRLPVISHNSIPVNELWLLSAKLTPPMMIETFTEICNRTLARLKYKRGTRADSAKLGL